MKNRTLGMLIVIAGVLAIFIKPEEYAWIVSAILIGGGTGISLFWKDKK